MGITPIVNLSPMLFVRTLEPDLEPLPMARVENSARTGDETYSPSNQKSARGAEDDGDEEDGAEDEFEELAAEEAGESPRQPTAKAPTRQISFFLLEQRKQKKKQFRPQALPPAFAEHISSL
jgi:hypothetical protein